MLNHYTIQANDDETKYHILNLGFAVCIEDDRGNRGKVVRFDSFEAAEEVADDLNRIDQSERFKRDLCA